MYHVVKLTESSMASGDDWNKLVFELDPATDPANVAGVELTVKNVFFEIKT